MLGTIFVSELVGTSMLLLLGCGVVANVVLPKTKGNSGGWLLINWGWGLAVFAGVLVSLASGGHINPAVTLGVIVSGAEEFVPGVPVSFASTMVYMSAQLLGGIIGATLAYLAHKKHFDEEAPAATKLAVFSTGAEIRSKGWNLVTEIIATFVLVFVILGASKFTGAGGSDPANLGWLGALGVAILIVGIGASLGGPTGYAINPTRDLGPRIVHAILPIKGKGGSDWGYSWVPVVGPIIGGVLAGLLSGVLLPAI